MREERQEEKYLGDLIHTEEDQTYLRRTAEKKKVLRTTVQGDKTKITSGATTLLHREGLSSAVEVLSTRGSS